MQANAFRAGVPASVIVWISEPTGGLRLVITEPFFFDDSKRTWWNTVDRRSRTNHPGFCASFGAYQNFCVCAGRCMALHKRSDTPHVAVIVHAVGQLNSYYAKCAP